MPCQAVYYRRQIKDHSVLARTSALVAVIMTTPSTPRELALKLSPGKITNGVVDNVRRHLSYLHNYGVIRILGRRGCGKRMAFVFAMQTSTFEKADDVLTKLDASNMPI